MDASDFPKLEALEICQSDLEEYIERVLAHSHKWTDTKGVRLTLDEINESDRIIRSMMSMSGVCTFALERR
jgi:hypothetical protein